MSENKEKEEKNPDWGHVFISVFFMLVSAYCAAVGTNSIPIGISVFSGLAVLVANSDKW